MRKMYSGETAAEAVQSMAEALRERQVPFACITWMSAADNDALLMLANCLITTVRLRMMTPKPPSGEAVTQ